MNELALFAGAGGGILGGHLLGWRTVCAVEWESYPASVLIARQNDGILSPFPIWDDVRTFDGRPWRGSVDVVSGGFPCQDISAAGKGAGIDGERSGMWHHMARIIGEVRPRYVFVENSPMLTSRGLGRVLGDLAALGYDVAWGVLGAVDAGAPHKRDRIWITAHAPDPACVDYGSRRAEPARQLGTPWTANGGDDVANSISQQTNSQWGVSECGRETMGRNEQATLEKDRCSGANRIAGQSSHVADADRAGFKEQRRAITNGAEHEATECGGWWEFEPNVGRVAHGVASRVDRLKAIGNGQVSAVAALAWKILSKRLKEKQ